MNQGPRVYYSHRITGCYWQRTSAQCVVEHLVQHRNNLGTRRRRSVKPPWEGANNGGMKPPPTRFERKHKGNERTTKNFEDDG